MRVANAGGVREQHVREFGSTVRGRLALRDWLAEFGVTQVAMEASGVYWKSPWAVLEDEFDCLLLNARRVKQVPGRKTDVADAEWLCRLVEAGQLRATQTPPRPQKALGAVKHTLITAIWHMLSTGEIYQDLGGDYFTHRDPERRTKRLIQQLQQLGHTVTIQAAPQAQT